MNPPRGAVLVAGSANLDLVVRASHVPAPGETVLGREFATFPGGKGANQAVACARAGGARTRMLVALGEDAYGRQLEGSLREAGVELHIVRVARQPTGVALICLADDAQNAIAVAPGANGALRGAHLPDLEGVACLLLQLETPLETVSDLARAARKRGVKVILNAAPARELPAELLADVDVLIVNEDELKMLAGKHDTVVDALTAVRVSCAIVTLGSRGACAWDRGKPVLQSAFQVDPVDTTAAGDTFCGTLAAALAGHRPLAEALRRACAAAALATTRLGAQASIPTRDEVERLLASPAHRGPSTDDALARYCGLSRSHGLSQ